MFYDWLDSGIRFNLRRDTGSDGLERLHKFEVQARQVLLSEATQKFGERIEVTQFARFSARG